MGYKVEINPPQTDGDQRAQSGCSTYQSTQMMMFGNASDHSDDHFPQDDDGKQTKPAARASMEPKVETTG